MAMFEKKMARCKGTICVELFALGNKEAQRSAPELFPSFAKKKSFCGINGEKEKRIRASLQSIFLSA